MKTTASKTNRDEPPGPELDSVTAYAKGVVSGRIPANRYVRLACERHLRDLLRNDVWFDFDAARRFFRFCRRHVNHYKGPMRGQPFVLEPWEKFVSGCIYGWKRCVLVDGDWQPAHVWKYNENYIEVPRKNGKTTMAAAMAAYDCHFLEETGAEVYCLATKEDQALLLFKDVAAYINASQQLTDTFEVLKGSNIIFSRESGRTSFIRPLGSDSKRQDGLNPIAAYCDELHAWPDRDLWDVMKQSFGARDSWHIVAITTAGHDRLGICYEVRDQLINTLEGLCAEDYLFGVIFTIDDSVRENDNFWQDEKNWFVANPTLGHGKQLSYMRMLAAEAKSNPKNINAFLNKQLNVWTDVEEAWLSIELWNSRGRDYNLEFLRYKRCTAAFDLARVNDLSAVAYVFPKQPGLDKIHLWVDFYLPRFELALKSKRDHVQYEFWEKQGWLTVTPGKTTDYNFIRRDINEKAALVRIGKVMYDRHFAGELVQNLTNDGFLLEPVGMGFISLSPPTNEVERQLIENEITHPKNPILTWNAQNTVVVTDAAGNRKPDKALSSKRIDGIVAVIMGEFDIIKNIPMVSKYETQNMVVVGGGRPKPSE